MASSVGPGNSTAATDQARQLAEARKLGENPVGSPQFDTQRVSVDPDNPAFEPLTVADLSSDSCGTMKCFRAVGLITLIAAAALFAFVTCYASGVFHWETFIGSIGPSVLIPLSGAIVILSAVTLASSYC